MGNNIEDMRMNNAAVTVEDPLNSSSDPVADMHNNGETIVIHCCSLNRFFGRRPAAFTGME